MMLLFKVRGELVIDDDQTIFILHCELLMVKKDKESVICDEPEKH
jgi:hypothetical protein